MRMAVPSEIITVHGTKWTCSHVGNPRLARLLVSILKYFSNYKNKKQIDDMNYLA